MVKINSQALYLVRYGAAQTAFELRDFNIVLPRNNEVLIEVEAFGLNYADVMARRKLYKSAPPLPGVLGYEVVGKIIHVGGDANPELLNRRVVAFTRFGGYAKHAITYDHAVAVIDDVLPAAAALALSTQFVTAYYMAVYLAPIHAGDKVLIHAAAGGVGTALVQLAKWKKAFVIAKVSSAEKVSLVKSLGADIAVNYKTSDYETQLDQLLAKDRIDVSYNPISGSTFKKDFRLLGPGGRLVLFGGSELVGAKGGIFASLNFIWKMGLLLPIGLMMRSKSILGVNMLHIADHKPEVLSECLQQVVALTQEGILTPQVGRTFQSDQLAEAHAFFESGQSTGKISVSW
jgi:NADPH:quinone reductase-like Zn-dependent oxidoreductase